MKHFGKAICIIDTCSIIALDGISLARKDLLKIVRQHFKVHVSTDICREVKKHRLKLISKEGSFWPSFVCTAASTPKYLKDDAKVLGSFYTTMPTRFTDNNAGERANARLSLELLLTPTYGHVVFLSDDMNARRAFLNALSDAFPGIDLWTSTDVVLYVGALLMKSRKCTWDELEGTLRDLRTNASNIRCFGGFDKNKMISLTSKHRKLVKRIKTVTQEWS